MIPRGSTTGAEAIAHMQIDDKDPLAFFVNKSGEFIINPKVVGSTRHTIDSKEGCMSYPAEPSKTVQRFNKIEVEFQTLLPGEKDGDKPILSPVMKINVSGRAAKVFQHECAHINGWNIYDSDFVPEGCKATRTDLDKNI
jgi:peptide deformylase